MKSPITATIWTTGYSHLLSEKQLAQDVRIWGEAARDVKPITAICLMSPPVFIIRLYYRRPVKDFVTTTEKNLDETGIKSAERLGL